MARLIEKPALTPDLHISRAGITVKPVEPGPVTQVSPLAGQHGAVGEALGVLGLGWPDPGEMRVSDRASVLWVGRDTALLFGAAPPLALEAAAALADQTGASAIVRIEGTGVEEVLARLVPVDLRPEALPVSRSIRTLVGHMTASVTRTGETEFELMVMRSMGGTLIHDLDRAIASWSARP